jgi:hypothetical protein
MAAVNNLHTLRFSASASSALRAANGRRRRARLSAVAILVVAGLASVFPGCEKPCQGQDDRDACTIDTCENGADVHTYLGDGHPCFLGRLEGACSAGFCIVPCTTFADCDDGKPCTKPLCANGACVFTEPDGDDPVNPIPPDGNVCTNDSCPGGEPWYWPVPGGTPCNDGKGECQNGVCSSCETKADCGADMVCREWICEQGKCVPEDAVKGTPADAVEIEQDCLKRVCDGHGGIDKVANPNDAPTSTNPCLAWTCVGWTPVVDVESQKGWLCTTPIGVVGVCDGEGSCVGCLDDNDCPHPMDRCYNHICVSCEDNTQNGGETEVDCGGSCGLCLGESCMADAECASDECVFTNAVPEKVCCNKPCDGECEECGLDGQCDPVPWGMPDEETCNSPMEACNGFKACKIKTGYACVSSVDCLSNSCNLVTKLCN